MEKTNNSIIVKEFVGSHYEDVPVMRNGKATKRTKQVLVRDMRNSTQQDTFTMVTRFSYLTRMQRMRRWIS